MDPVTRYQDALAELHEAAKAFLHPAVLDWLDFDRFARVADLPELPRTAVLIPDNGGGDPLVP